MLLEKRTGSSGGRRELRPRPALSLAGSSHWRCNLEKVPPCPTSAQLHLQSWTVDLTRIPFFWFSAAQEMPGGGRCPECGSAELVEDSHYSQNQLVCSDCGCVVTEGVLTTTFTDEGNLRGIFGGAWPGPWRQAGEAGVVHAGRWRWRKKLKVFLRVLGGEHSWRGSGDQICAHLVDVDLLSTRPAWLPARTGPSSPLRFCLVLVFLWFQGREGERKRAQRKQEAGGGLGRSFFFSQQGGTWHALHSKHRRSKIKTEAVVYVF